MESDAWWVFTVRRSSVQDAEWRESFCADPEEGRVFVR